MISILFSLKKAETALQTGQLLLFIQTFRDFNA